MRVIRRTAVAALAIAAVAIGGMSADASAQRGTFRLHGNVAPWTANATPHGGAVQGTMSISVYLRLRNESGLQQLLARVNDPKSPQYRHFLEPARFRAFFSPSRADIAAVTGFLMAHGLRVGYVPANRSYVTAVSSVRSIERAFGVRERFFRYRGMTLRGTTDNPRLPRTLAPLVRYVGGLDDTNRLVRAAARTPVPANERPSAPPGPGYATPGPCSTYWADHTATVTPPAYQYGSTLPWTPCGYTPPQIRAAYGVDRTLLTGAGVTVGITDAFASPTIVNDVNTFSAHYGLPLLGQSNFQQLAVPGASNFPENRFDPQGWFGEETLDVEWVHAMAPHAKIIFAGGQNSTVPLDHALIDMIDKHRADVITNSWGIYGEPNAPGKIKADEQAFEQAAAEGITVLFSSGDNGDVADITGLAQGSWPATSPFVTAVGGTSLGLRASGAKDEWGWGTYLSQLAGSTTSNGGTTVTGTGWSPWPPEFLYGSGGGISLHFGQPAYQAGVVPNTLATSTTTADGRTVTFSTPHRVTPDISLVGDPNTGVLVGETYQVSGDALIDADCTPLGGGFEYCERRIGGTSLSSPLLAGIVALVDEARKTAGKGPIGFLNPALYALGTGSAAIRDVLPPGNPTAVLRNAGTTGNATTLRTMNSVPVGTTGPVIEGADTSLRTTAGWDNVTGLGTPWVPDFVTALTQSP
jgi:subtilase family serine protease